MAPHTTDSHTTDSHDLTTVSRVGFGAMQLERLHGDPAAANALLRRAIELGVDHIDTAQFYGNGVVNGFVRDALRPEDGVVIVSKVGADANPEGPVPLRAAQRPEQLRASVEANLVGLGVDSIPVVNLRRLDRQPGLRAEGDQIVGAIGLSTVTLDGLRRALPAGLVCVQNAYSLANRDDDDMLALCVTEGIAWVPYFPLGSAFPQIPKVTDRPAVQAVAARLGFTPSQIGLAWLLNLSPDVLLIPGTADIAHLEANMAAGEIDLDAETMEELVA
jgi:pyridoxine 4-dehydrogenase